VANKATATVPLSLAIKKKYFANLDKAFEKVLQFFFWIVEVALS